jgi:3-hydroxyacyl-CoA dehydrogenase
MNKRRISKIAVIGSGIMGSGIACHFANIGVEVLLLDMAPNELTDKEKASGLQLTDQVVRNRIVNSNLLKAIKFQPRRPLYHNDFKNRIRTGNLNDDLSKIADVDWIIEVVVERLDIKQKVFEQIEKHRTAGTLITSNTSGIPIAMMNKGRSEDFQQHFAVTHFFNPPRYLKLFEVIPGPNCLPDVTSFLMDYGRTFLGKSAVLAKDTPAFIGNRIGIFCIQSLFHQVKDMGLTVEEIDKLTGPVIGRPKSATFRTVDVVGLDTLVHVATGLYENCKKDERREVFTLPSFISKMMENQWMGSKSGQGFYKKVKNDNGKSEILTLDLDTLEYRTKKRAKFATLEKTKTVDNLKERYPILIDGDDKAAQFYRKNFGELFAYIQHRIPEISDEIYRIDDAMKAGFGWTHGPFELWDSVGLKTGVMLIEEAGHTPAEWVLKMVEGDHLGFYELSNGQQYFYNIPKKKMSAIPGQNGFVILDNIRKENTVWKNQECSLVDLGDGVLNIEFHSKMNTIGAGVLQGINKGVEVAEKEFQALVVGNQGTNFSAGANIGMIFMLAIEQEYDELNMAIKYFQDTMMRMRYSPVPTVAAPHTLTLGGGCELCLHADKVVAAAETYIGLVEFGVGVIPGGGGSKEMTLRASDSLRKNDVELNVLQEYFLTIGMAKVAKSAHEAYDLGILQKGKDLVVTNSAQQIAIAKKHALLLAEAGYTQPIKRTDVKVLGKQALGMFLVGTDSMEVANYISEHDKKIANKLAYVMAGGDLSQASYVSEEYLLDLEREAFLSLCTERKTLERIQHMLKTGKPLRN